MSLSRCQLIGEQQAQPAPQIASEPDGLLAAERSMEE
jgi:hypothetical protein